MRTGAREWVAEIIAAHPGIDTAIPLTDALKAWEDGRSQMRSQRLRMPCRLSVRGWDRRAMDEKTERRIAELTGQATGTR